MSKLSLESQKNRFLNARRVLKVILEEQRSIDDFTGKKSKEAISYERTILLLKERELKVNKKIKKKRNEG